MKILVNVSNIVIGGGIQVAVWFIRQALENNLNCYFAISSVVAKELSAAGIALPEGKYLIFDNSPARNKTSRLILKDYAEQNLVDVVYTIFGPSYVRFRQPHVLGFADGWLSHSSINAFKRTFSSNIKAGITLLITSLYKAFWLKFADAWVFETKVAAKGLSKRICLDSHKCFVVGNSCSDRFIKEAVVPSTKDEPFTLLYFTADYAHKGILNYVDYAKALYRLAPEKKFTFKITISEESETANKILAEIRNTEIENYFDFCGHINTDKAVSVMDSANVVMQTSYLETFSANYPEAMARKRPLIVSHFQFAKDICEDAAIYVNPDDPYDVAKAIIQLHDDEELVENLCRKGAHVLSKLLTSEKRFNHYLEILTLTAKGNK